MNGLASGQILSARGMTSIEVKESGGRTSLRKPKKTLLWVIGRLAAFLALFLALMAILPRFINLTPIRERMLANISRAVGGKVNCQRVGLAFLPRPQVLIDGGSVSVPGKVRGHMESLTIYPRILPLLTADVKVAAIEVEAPNFTIEVPRRRQQEERSRKTNSSDSIERKIVDVLDAVVSKAPGLVVLVQNGSLHLFQESQSVVSLDDINGRVLLPSRSIEVDLACRSQLWESLCLKGWWDLRNSPRKAESPDNQSSPLVSLEIEGKSVNVDATREATLTLAGDTSIIRNIFGVLQGGKAPWITFKAQGNHMADLKKKENIVIAGSMTEGKLSIPKVDLDLEEVSGEAVISEGVLHGSNLEARYGHSLGKNGTLTLGLAGKEASLRLDIEMEADLAELPAFLKKQIKNKTFVEEIGLIDEFRGHGTGRLLLGESLASIKTRVTVSSFNLSAKYRRIPYPLKLGGGRFSYDENGIHVESLNGSIGRSSFSGVFAGLKWGPPAYLELRAAGTKLLLKEIYAWLTSYETVRARLSDLQSVKGLVALSALSLKGPLLKPKDWRFDTKGETKELAIEASLFSAPIEVTRGVFHAVEDGIKQEFSFAETQTGVLDATLKGSGVLKGYLTGLQGAEINVEGSMGSQFIRWLSSLAVMPSMLEPTSPLSISQGHLSWERNARTSFAGDLTPKNGPKVSIDILKDDGGFRIGNMSIEDQETSAFLKLEATKKALNLEFKGRVTKATMDRLFEGEQAGQGWIEGDIELHILMDEPMKSKARGTLEGGDLHLPLNVTGPLEIDRISLEAKRDTLEVSSADFIWEDNHMAAKGDVAFSPDGLQFDMDLFAKSVDWETIAAALYRNSEAQEDEAQGGFWDLPIYGKLRLHTEDFTYDRFTWAPLHAEIAFKRNAVDIAISEADLCGIATPGTLIVTPQHMTLDFKPVSRDQDLDATFACFSGRKKQMTGDFDLKGEITGQEKPEAILKSLQGNLEFVAKDGRFYRYGLLAKVLAFVNLTEVFRGKVPRFTREGFAYDSMRVKGSIEDGKFVLKEGFIDAPSVDIAYYGHVDFMNKQLDLKYLVAPLKTVDFVVRKIPLVGRILGGTLVSAPVRVTGDWANPSVTALSPSAVGSGLLGIMERTLKTPVEIMEWRPSGGRPEPDSVRSE